MLLQLNLLFIKQAVYVLACTQHGWRARHDEVCVCVCESGRTTDGNAALDAFTLDLMFALTSDALEATAQKLGVETYSMHCEKCCAK